MNICPTCKSPTNKYPGGVSKKTGKEYSARTQCDNPDCDWVQWEPRDQKSPKMSQAANNIYQDEVLKRLGDRLDSIDEKMDSIIAYFIDNKKEELREKSWMPSESSQQSETPLPHEGL